MTEQPDAEPQPDELDEVPAVYAHAGVAEASGGAGPDDEEGGTDALD